MAPFLLLLLPVLVSGSAVSINYKNSSEADTHILLVSYPNYANLSVNYNFSVSNPKIPIAVWNPNSSKMQICDVDEPYCIFPRSMGVQINVVLNYGETTSFEFSIDDYLDMHFYEHLQIFANGCQQDISQKCRSMNYTNVASEARVCMCSGMNNFCAEEPLPMWTDGNCFDGPPPTDTPIASNFELSVFYGTSHGLGSYVMDISRENFGSGTQVKFTFNVSSTAYQVEVSGAECSPQCSSIINVGNDLVVTIQEQFSFTLYQSMIDQTEVIYGQCGEVVTECRDTPDGIAYYGCLCPGKTATCTAPTVVNETCLGTTTVSAIPTLETITTPSTTTSTSTSTTTTSTTTTTTTTAPVQPWKLYAFYGSTSNQTRMLEIDRVQLTSVSATFNFYSRTGDYIEVDGSVCLNCTKTLEVNNRMDVIITNEFHFYLFEEMSTTTVGLGDMRCDQNITTQCKMGLLEDSLYGCLCENTAVCLSPAPFDQCGSTTVTESNGQNTTTSSTTPSTTTSSTSTSTSTSTSITITTSIPTTTVTTVSTTTPVTTSLPVVVPTPFPSLQNLSDSTIGQNNVTQILNDTLTYSNNKGDLTSDQIDDISIILSKSANVSGLNETDSILILSNMDNCMSAPYDSISETTANRMNSVFQPMVVNTNATSIDYLQGDNLGFSSKMIDCSDPNQYHGLMDNVTMFVNLKSNPTNKHNAIQIPISAICSQQQDASHVYFTIYRERKLFVGSKKYRTYNNNVWADNKDGRWPGPDPGNSRVKRDTDTTDDVPSPCDDQTLVAADSPVMSGTILSNGGATVSRLATQNPVAELQFNVQGLLTPLHGKYVVTWWDTENNVWATSDECKTEKKGDLVLATCNHLTDFTLIVNGALDDPMVCDTALSITGYVANGLSIASLSFLFVIYICAFIPLFADAYLIKFMNGYAVAKRDSVSLSYTTSLLLFYIVFTIFATQDIAGNACSAMAAIAYSLFLGTILMNVFKCLRITARFIPGRSRDFFKFLQRAVVFDTISTIVPFVISLLLLLLTDFFNRNDTFCWVRVDYIIFATVIPISILVVNACIAVSLAAYRLCSTSMRVKRRGKHVDYQLGPKLANILILQFTLGLPWVLQYFTLALPKVSAWHYAFTIVLGSQGTVLALLFFYKRQRILRSSRYAKKLASMQTQTTTTSNSS